MLCNKFCWTFKMIVVMVVTFLIFSCLPLLQAVTNDKISTPDCPESFSRPNLAPFKYPFTKNATDEGCRLIKVNCTTKGGEIKLGDGQSYEIVEKVDSGPSVVIRNRTFQNLVNTKSCEALMHNYTSPNPLLYSVSITPFIALFKCRNNFSYTDFYFDQPDYKSYNKCKDYNFYYKYLISNGTVFSDLPHTCQEIKLPVKVKTLKKCKDVDETNIFSLLSSSFSISFGPPLICEECNRKGNPCYLNNNGQFQCKQTKKDKTGRGPTLIKIMVIAASAFILVLSFAIFIIWRRYKNNPFSYFTSKDKSSSLECGVSVFSYTELESATQNFSPSHELGDGGFGAVYYGKLKDGREVAVKKLYEHNYRRVQQFLNEVEILTKLRHPNLVVLYGSTSKQSHELLLVYEYIPNGTVSDHLHGEQAHPTFLTWPIRMNIAIETASALVYLHANEIIHRDVKTNNILLDHNFCVKVADFGLSRLIPNNVTHVSTAPQGTPGYLDPQYHQRYQLTDKSDVYSFGVVLVELITSMVAVDLNRSQDEISLANFALNRIQRCAFEQLIDPLLVSDSNSIMMAMIKLVAELAFRCLQYDSETRPTMNEVLDVLMDIKAEGKTDTHENTITDSETVKSPPPSERNDTVVLLEEFLPSPVSVTSEWESEKSASTTVSSNKDRLPMNSIST